MTSAEVAAALREHPHGSTIAVRVQPGAKKTAIVGVYGEGQECALRIAVQAPPVEGRANEALIEFFATTLKLPKSSVIVLSGKLSRSKVLLVHNVSRAELQTLLVHA